MTDQNSASTPPGAELAQLRQQVAALETEKANLVALIDHTDSYIWSVDTECRFVDGNTALRKAAASVLGGEPSPGVLMLPPEVMPEVRAAWQGYYARALKGERFCVDEQTPLVPGQSLYLFFFAPIWAAGGVITGATVYTRDIPDRHQAELAGSERLKAAQQESENNFAALFQASPDVMVITRMRDGIVVDVNEAAVAHTGYARDEFLGRSAATNEMGMWADLADRERLLAALRQTGQAEGQEAQFRIRDGTVRHAQMSARLIQFGGELCMLTVTRDITTRVRAEQARAAAEAALRESEARYRELAEENTRLFLKSQAEAANNSFLLHEVNHRVKNNLAAILGLLQVELNYLRAEDPSPFHAMVQDLSARIQSLLLVHNLLSTASGAPLSLARLASTVMRVAPAMLSRQQAPVQMDISPLAVPLTPKQANAFGLMLNELATNSLKYAAGDEPIQLSLHFTQTGQAVSLEYRDNGPGFPAEVLRGERKSVGMYLVQTLAEYDLQGKLELSNDHGAVVHLEFSLADEREEAAPLTEPAAPGVSEALR